MADIGDVASDYAELDVATSLQKHKNKQRIRPSSNFCQECGDTLEKHRITYGICIDCATILEKESKLYNRL